MVRRRGFVSAALAAVVTFIVLEPFDEIVLSLVFAKAVFGLGWVESLLIGVIVGCVVLAVVEVWNGED